MSGAFITSAILAGAADRIGASGKSPDAVAELAGIPPAALRDPEVMVLGSAVIRFFEIAAQACGNRNWGLELSVDASLAAVIGPLWILLRNARSVRELCDDFSRNFDLHTSTALLSFEMRGADGVLGWSAAAGQASGDVQVAEFALSIILKEIRMHAPSGWTPRRVSFRHAPPDDLSLHRRLFGPGLQFNADGNCIEIDAGTLAMPVRRDASGRRGAARGMVRDVLRLEDGVPERSTPLRVESIVRTLLPYAPCSARDVGLAMGIALRTLQERLKATDSSFRAIKDAVRADLAMKYLAHSDMSVTQIANVLGFSEPASFSRSFRRWYGRTARSVRSGNRGRQ